MNYFIEEFDSQNIDAVVTQTGCMGYCYAEPTVEITLPGKAPVVFGGVDEAKARELVTEYVMKGEPVEGIIPVTYERVVL